MLLLGKHYSVRKSVLRLVVAAAGIIGASSHMSPVYSPEKKEDRIHVRIE